MAIRALSLVLLFIFVSVIFGLPTISEQAINTHEEYTLSTERLPPSSDEKEQEVIVYVINLYGQKNDSTTSSEIIQNEDTKTSDILEPLASVFLVVDDGENIKIDQRTPVDLDKFAEELEGQGFKVDKVDLNSNEKVLKMKLEKAQADNMMTDSVLKGEKKYRQKRFLSPHILTHLIKLHLHKTYAGRVPHINPYYNPIFDPSVNPLINPHYNGLINPFINPLVNPKINPLINPLVNPFLNEKLNPHLNPRINPAINPVLNPIINPFINPLANEHINPLATLSRNFNRGFEHGYQKGYMRGQSAPHIV